jgi:hypothetical protein
MPPCKNDPKSSYKGDEPSPKGLGYCAHAEKVGTMKKGRDGNKWIISETSKKIKRWIKISSKKEKSKTNIKREEKVKSFFTGKKYYIHDNGGRPFLVIVNGKEVSIYKREKYDGRKYKDYDEYEKSPYDILITKIKAKTVIIGKDRHPGFAGNSILLDMGKNKYICITDTIFEFELEKGDKFIKYFSLVGNSDVPYPVLLGENYFYSMIDRTRGSRKYFPENYKTADYEEGHDFYYGTFNRKTGWVSQVKDKKKLKHLKIIEKRFY